MLDYKHINRTLQDKPIVWTLADMNAFTGGCHYSQGCDGYMRECENCPLLGGGVSLAHKTWQIKKKAYEGLKNIHIVCPSAWLAERARKSSLLKGKPIYVIPNIYPVDKYIPVNKNVARMELGLPIDKKLIMFGADNLTVRRKGGDMLASLAETLAQHTNGYEIEFMLFGRDVINIDLPVHRLGYVSDEKQLSLMYSAADVYLFPSREDNAPLTVGESLLCGTPVVGFPVGNVTDVIIHKESGYIAEYLNYDDLVRGIYFILDQDEEYALRQSLRCRLTMQNLCSEENTINKYIQLYRDITGVSGSGNVAAASYSN